MSARIHYAAGPSAARANSVVPKRDIGQGILLQVIAEGANLNAVHWNIPDGDVVPPHQHPQEQFGYVIKGALELTVDGQPLLVGEGDSYLIPSNALHGFRARGVTEAIDVFSPLRDLSTAGGQHR